MAVVIRHFGSAPLLSRVVERFVIDLEPTITRSSVIGKGVIDLLQVDRAGAFMTYVNSWYFRMRTISPDTIFEG